MTFGVQPNAGQIFSVNRFFGKINQNPENLMGKSGA
jgi:hypothetical protein